MQMREVSSRMGMGLNYTAQIRPSQCIH